MEQPSQTAAPPRISGPWLWAFRIMYGALLLWALGAVGLEVLQSGGPGRNSLLLFFCLAGPFAFILWMARSNPPHRSSLVVAIVVSFLALAADLFGTVALGSFPRYPELYLPVLGVLAYMLVPVRILYGMSAEPRPRRLVVIPSIAVVVAVALAFVLSARRPRGHSMNDSSAVGSVRSINTAQVTYQSTYPSVGFTCDLKALGPPASGPPSAQAADLLDSVLTSGTKSGFTFRLTQCSGTPATTYRSVAVPIRVGETGIRAFCSDESGDIRFSEDGSGDHCLQSGTPLE